MLFWHVGATIGFIRYAFRDEAMDLRILALGSLLPDLIDTPIGLALWPSFRSVRLASHTILFASVLLVLVMATTRRGRPRKRWMPLAVGVLIHLVLDAMWTSPATLWWPFLGWDFDATSYQTAWAYLEWLLTDMRTWGLEAVGLAYLSILARRSQLGEPDARQTLLRTGRVSAPIGR
jgi:hypothetical protein